MYFTIDIKYYRAQNSAQVRLASYVEMEILLPIIDALWSKIKEIHHLILY